MGSYKGTAVVPTMILVCALLCAGSVFAGGAREGSDPGATVVEATTIVDQTGREVTVPTPVER